MNPKSAAAVLETDGLVLMHDQKLVPAAYHSVCGGHTEFYSLMRQRKNSGEGGSRRNVAAQLKSSRAARAYIMNPP